MTKAEFKLLKVKPVEKIHVDFTDVKKLFEWLYDRKRKSNRKADAGKKGT